MIVGKSKGEKIEKRVTVRRVTNLAPLSVASWVARSFGANPTSDNCKVPFSLFFFPILSFVSKSGLKYDNGQAAVEKKAGAKVNNARQVLWCTLKLAGPLATLSWWLHSSIRVQQCQKINCSIPLSLSLSFQIK